MGKELTDMFILEKKIWNGKESYIGFGLGDLNAELLEAGEELLGVDFSVSIIVINNSESSAEASNGCGASGV